MKIVALSCGRRGGNNEILLKQALKSACEISGAKVDFIRLFDLKIEDCLGCEGCTKSLTTGGDGKCVVYKNADDMQWLMGRIADSDALMIATPIYDLIPSGKTITLLNRALGVGKEFRETSMEKKRLGAVISLGGSDWIDFAEPIADATAYNLSKGLIMIDRMIIGYNPTIKMVLLDDEAMERASLLGRRLGEALLDKEHASFAGDSGICPYCHCNYLVPNGGTRVVCPFCAANGSAYIENGNLKVKWDENAATENRYTPYGQKDHHVVIKRGHNKALEGKPLIAERDQEFRDLFPAIKP